MEPPKKILVVGEPLTGKSSIIRAFREQATEKQEKKTQSQLTINTNSSSVDNILSQNDELKVLTRSQRHL